MIKIVLLDVDNTLLDFHAGAEESMKAAFLERGIPWKPEEFLPVFHTINNGLWKDMENGIISMEELYRIRWQKILDALHISEDGLIFEKIFKQNLGKSHIPIPGAMELLQYLSAKYRLCAASNGPYQQQINRLQMAGMNSYFSDYFISEEVGFSKPEQEYFRVCRERLGNPEKKEMMMIGDSLTSDMRGASNFEIQTCWYNHDQIPIPQDLKVDYIVNSLKQVKEIL